LASAGYWLVVVAVDAGVAVDIVAVVAVVAHAAAATLLGVVFVASTGPGSWTAEAVGLGAAHSGQSHAPASVDPEAVVVKVGLGMSVAARMAVDLLPSSSASEEGIEHGPSFLPVHLNQEVHANSHETDRRPSSTPLTYSYYPEECVSPHNLLPRPRFQRRENQG
jgi:hypothetical protein